MRSRFRRPRIRRRRPRVESLERRQLLTVIAPDVWWPNTDQFTVRRDEAEPVELHVSRTWRDWVGGFEDDSLESVQSDHGSVQIAPGGRTILYQPEPGFIGIDLVTVTFTDPDPKSDDDELPPVAVLDGDAADVDLPELTKTIAVNVVEPLLAVDDWYQVDVNADPFDLAVLDNDVRNANYILGGERIGEEPELTVTDFNSDGDGLISIEGEGGYLTYTPAAGFQGVETITYTTVDQDGYTAEGTAQVRVSSDDRDSLWPEQLQQQLVEAATLQHRYSFGGPAHEPWFDVRADFFLIDDVLAPAIVGLSNGDVPENNTVSGTNNQLAGVDESDRVKTDGEYLYVLTTPDEPDWFGWDILPWIDVAFPGDRPEQDSGENLLTVVDIRQPDAPAIVARQLFEDRVLSLDLAGDRLTVLSQRDDQTVVTALDIADPLTINTVWTTVVDGQFKQARRVDGTLYVFTDDYGSDFPHLESICDESEEFCFFETGREYLARVRDTLVESVFPSQQVFDAAGNRVDSVPSMLIDPLLTELPEYYQYLNIITFDTSSDVGGAVDWDISSGAEHVLVTPESIYVTHTNYQSVRRFVDDIDIFDDIPEEPTITTEIERFAIAEDGTVDLSATGGVPGVLNNSFSLDEHQGLLRIATENSWWSLSPEDDGTNIYVLQQADAELETIGGVTGLAPGEQIYAVRFAGDRGYVVTFRRVDPLFVVDLSEPTAPEVMGQLKVPGYSQYLHIIDDNHIIGVGRDAEEETGLYQGLIVSLFNVSDPADPTVQDRYEFAGGRTTFSPFAEDSPWDLRDHHAISYFPESGILALPVYSKHEPWLADESEQIFESPDQSAVRTLHIDTTGGIEELDWIEFDSRADRTVRVGELLYSLSNRELKVTHLLQPDGIVASLEFERHGTDDFVDTEVGDEVTIDVVDNDGSGGEIEILGATLVEGEGDVEVVEGQIRFRPATRSLAHQRIRYTARDAAGTLIDAFATVDPDIQWQNEAMTLDVNNDGKRSARDAVNVINWLDRYGGGDSEEIESQIGHADAVELFYFDTTGDGKLSPRDALLIINDLIKDILIAETPGLNADDPILASVADGDPGIAAEGEKVASFDALGDTFRKAADVVFTQYESEEGSDELLAV